MTDILVITGLSGAGRSNAADDLFGLLCDESMNAMDVEALARERGLIQITDAGALARWVAEAIDAQPQAAKDFAEGKDAALGRLVGHIMKVSKGQADARAAQIALRERLRSSEHEDRGADERAASWFCHWSTS